MKITFEISQSEVIGILLRIVAIVLLISLILDTSHEGKSQVNWYLTQISKIIKLVIE